MSYFHEDYDEEEYYTEEEKASLRTYDNYARKAISILREMAILPAYGKKGREPLIELVGMYAGPNVVKSLFEDPDLTPEELEFQDDLPYNYEPASFLLPVTPEDMVYHVRKTWDKKEMTEFIHRLEAGFPQPHLFSMEFLLPGQEYYNYPTNWFIVDEGIECEALMWKELEFTSGEGGQSSNKLYRNGEPLISHNFPGVTVSKSQRMREGTSRARLREEKGHDRSKLMAGYRNAEIRFQEYYRGVLHPFEQMPRPTLVAKSHKNPTLSEMKQAWVDYYCALAADPLSGFEQNHRVTLRRAVWYLERQFRKFMEKEEREKKLVKKESEFQINHDTWKLQDILKYTITKEADVEVKVFENGKEEIQKKKRLEALTMNLSFGIPAVGWNKPGRMIGLDGVTFNVKTGEITGFENNKTRVEVELEWYPEPVLHLIHKVEKYEYLDPRCRAGTGHITKDEHMKDERSTAEMLTWVLEGVLLKEYSKVHEEIDMKTWYLARCENPVFDPEKDLDNWYFDGHFTNGKGRGFDVKGVAVHIKNLTLSKYPPRPHVKDVPIYPDVENGDFPWEFNREVYDSDRHRYGRDFVY